MHGLLWGGSLLSVFGIVSYFHLFSRFPALRDNALLNLSLVTLGAAMALGGFVGVWRAKPSFFVRAFGALGVGVSIFCTLMLFHYVFVTSNTLPEPDRRTLTIASIPEITLSDQHGREVAIQERRDRKLVLSFYRGHW